MRWLRLALLVLLLRAQAADVPASSYEHDLEACLLDSSLLSCNAADGAGRPTVKQTMSRCLLVVEGGPELQVLKMLAPDVPFAHLLVNASRAFTDAAGLPPVNWTLPSADAIPFVTSRDLGLFAAPNQTAPRAFHAYLMPSSAIGSLVSRINLPQDLSELTAGDRDLDWPGFLPLFREVMSVYDGAVKGIPILGKMLQLYYRRDLLSSAGLVPPRTWTEAVAVAARFNGTDLNGDGQPDYGICLWRTACEGTSSTVLAVLASIVQSKGRSAGLIFLPSNMSLVTDTVAWPATLALLRRLSEVAAPVDTRGNSPTTPCLMQPLFQEGRCALALGLASQFKSGSQPGSLVRGKVGTTVLPGSELVLDWEANTLRPCDSDICPFATRHQLPASSVAAGYRQAPGSGSGSGASGWRASGSAPSGSVDVWVNRAPYSPTGGQTLFISSFKTMPQRLATFHVAVAMLRATAESMIVDPGNEFGPTRTEHLDGRVWLEHGYHPGDLSEFLAATKESLESGNVAIEIRIADRLFRDLMELTMHPLLGDWTVPGSKPLPLDEAVALSREIFSSNFSEAAKADLADAYRASIRFVAPKPQRLTGASTSSTSSTGLTVAAVLAGVLGSLALGLTAACVAWQVSRTRARGRRFGRVLAPGAGKGTTLALCEVADGDRLWEALPEGVMARAEAQALACLRSCAAAVSGYEAAPAGTRPAPHKAKGADAVSVEAAQAESGTGGGSRLLASASTLQEESEALGSGCLLFAFHSPEDALVFALEAQAELLHVAWPPELLKVDSCGPFYATPRANAPLQGAVAQPLSPILSPRATHAGEDEPTSPLVPGPFRKSQTLKQILHRRAGSGNLSVAHGASCEPPPRMDFAWEDGCEAAATAASSAAAVAAGARSTYADVRSPVGALTALAASSAAPESCGSWGQQSRAGQAVGLPPAAPRAAHRDGDGGSPASTRTHSVGQSGRGSKRGGGGRGGGFAALAALLGAGSGRRRAAAAGDLGSAASGSDAAPQHPSSVDAPVSQATSADPTAELEPRGPTCPTLLQLYGASYAFTHTEAAASTPASSKLAARSGPEAGQAATPPPPRPHDLTQRKDEKKVHCAPSTEGKENGLSGDHGDGAKSPRVLLLCGLRVRIGCHLGVHSTSDVVYDKPSSRFRYTGVPLAKTRALTAAAPGGMVLLSGSTHGAVLAAAASAPAPSVADVSGSGPAGLLVCSKRGGGPAGTQRAVFWHGGVLRLDPRLPQTQDVFMASTPELAPRWALLPAPGGAPAPPLPSPGPRHNRQPHSQAPRALAVASGVSAAPLGPRLAIAAVTVSGAAAVAAWNHGLWAEAAGLVWREGAALCRAQGGFLATTRGAVVAAACAGGGAAAGKGRRGEAQGAVLLTAAFAEPAAAVRWGAQVLAFGLLAPWPPSLLLHELCEEQLFLGVVPSRAAPQPSSPPPAGPTSSQDAEPCGLRGSMLLAALRAAAEGLVLPRQPPPPPGAVLPPAPPPPPPVSAAASPKLGPNVRPVPVRASVLRPPAESPHGVPVSTAGPLFSGEPSASGGVSGLGGLSRGFSGLPSAAGGGGGYGYVSGSAGPMLPSHVGVRQLVQLPGHDATLPDLEPLSGASTYGVGTVAAAAGAIPPGFAHCAPGLHESVPRKRPVTSAAVSETGLSSNGGGGARTPGEAGSGGGGPAGADAPVRPPPDPSASPVSALDSAPPSGALPPGPLLGAPVRPSRVAVPKAAAVQGSLHALLEEAPSQAVRLMAARLGMQEAQEPNGLRRRGPSGTGHGGDQPAHGSSRASTAAGSDPATSTSSLLPAELLDQLIARGLRLRAGVGWGPAVVEVDLVRGDAHYRGPAASSAQAAADQAPLSHLLVSEAAVESLGEGGRRALAKLHPAVAARVRFPARHAQADGGGV